MRSESSFTQSAPWGSFPEKFTAEVFRVFFFHCLPLHFNGIIPAIICVPGLLWALLSKGWSQVVWNRAPGTGGNGSVLFPTSTFPLMRQHPLISVWISLRILPGSSWDTKQETAPEWEENFIWHLQQAEPAFLALWSKFYCKGYWHPVFSSGFLCSSQHSKVP